MRTADAIDNFLEISTFLTGFSGMELLGTGMLDTYYNVVINQSAPALTDAFFAASEKILAAHRTDPARLNEEIAAQLIPDALFGGLAQNIITMWYMGSWGNTVISPQTYVQGLVWGVAGTHPPGAKQPGYGSWSRLPLSVTSSPNANA